MRLTTSHNLLLVPTGGSSEFALNKGKSLIPHLFNQYLKQKDLLVNSLLSVILSLSRVFLPDLELNFYCEIFI